jgi:hypothetical protein
MGKIKFAWYSEQFPHFPATTFFEQGEILR